jgi:hypothetical protein
MNAHVWVKRALLLIIIGLIVQLFCLVHVTPGSFMIFAMAGVGPMVLGLAAFVYAMALARRRREVHDER